ncbi:MAG TPA: hypothetical protein VJ203_07965 [Bacteroidales bacterium]|nr:hypothetical protein [Bacteroidales bacterium]
MGLLITGCRQQEETEEQRLTWSTEAPLSIPYRARLKQAERANLVRNHSFETGRTFLLDNMTKSFVIDGWQQVGQHVEWVDVRNDSLYQVNEALSGHRAVKIVRHQAYETDEQGEGIMSDFIKVIPGNYNFSFYTRIENAFPLRARLGTRMYDAIDIRLLYFDRNKIPISPKQPFPQADQVVDNSFKSLSFANFNSVPSFGWGKIRGKSAYFPFPEGDIPSSAHYVKIFLGLKGKGTMWIDSVHYGYSASNFSVAERMSSYTDTSFYLQQVILPTPRKVQKMESVIFYNTGQNTKKLPVILVPADADTLTMQAAELIRSSLLQSIKNAGGSTVNASDITIVRADNGEGVRESKLVFSVGNTSLYRKYREILPQREIAHYPQGYFIYSTNDLPNLVFLGGNTAVGIYYAALTAIQLVDERKPVFHGARIIDYPDFENRYYTIKGLNDPETARNQSKIAAGLVKYKLNGAVYLDGMENGPGGLIPESGLFHIDYRGRPVINNEMIDALSVSFSDKEGEGLGYFYTGSSFFSLNTDDADLQRYISFSGSKPVFMDNSMLTSEASLRSGGNFPYYPGRVRLHNVVDPFSNTGIREQYSGLDSSLFVVNLPAGGSELDIVRIATAADFLWNRENYSPELSLWKVLLSRYGAIVARDLIGYSDRYGMMLEILVRLKKNEQVARNVKNGQVLLAALEKHAAAISSELGALHPLVSDIGLLNSEAKKQLNVFLTGSGPRNE